MLTVRATCKESKRDHYVLKITELKVTTLLYIGIFTINKKWQDVLDTTPFSRTPFPIATFSACRYPLFRLPQACKILIYKNLCDILHLF